MINLGKQERNILDTTNIHNHQNIQLLLTTELIRTTNYLLLTTELIQTTNYWLLTTEYFHTNYLSAQISVSDKLEYFKTNKSLWPCTDRLWKFKWFCFAQSVRRESQAESQGEGRGLFCYCIARLSSPVPGWVLTLLILRVLTALVSCSILRAMGRVMGSWSKEWLENG